MNVDEPNKQTLRSNVAYLEAADRVLAAIAAVADSSAEAEEGPETISIHMCASTDTALELIRRS